MPKGVYQEKVNALHAELSSLARLYQLQSREENGLHGLSISQEHAVRILAEVGSMRMSMLAEKLSLSLSALTKLIDGLENRALVRRFSGRDDGRVVNLRLTPKGQTLCQKVHDDFNAHLSDSLRSCSLADVETVIKGLKLLNSSISAWQERNAVPAGNSRLRSRRQRLRADVRL